MPTDAFIYDEKGRWLARVIDGNVVAGIPPRKIGTVKGANVFDLEGNFICGLSDAHLTMPSPLPEALTRLVD